MKHQQELMSILKSILTIYRNYPSILARQNLSNKLDKINKPDRLIRSDINRSQNQLPSDMTQQTLFFHRIYFEFVKYFLQN